MDAEKRVKNAMRSFHSATEQLETVERADPLDEIAAFTPHNFMPPPSACSPSKPRCRPWSQPDYIVRLCTFSPKTWFGKPLSASPLECARHGWINDGPDSLRCQCCDATLTVKADLDDANQAVADVSKGHGEYCPWRNNPCPSYVTLFPVMSPEALKASLLTRLTASTAMIEHYHKRLGVDVPDELHALLKEEGVTLLWLAQCLSMESKKPPAREGGEEGPVGGDEELMWATVLALYGWEPSRHVGARREETMDMGFVMHCGTCGRSMPVWPLVSQRLMEAEDRSKARRVEQEGGGGGGRIAMFQPVTEHRWYCPWISSASPEERPAGWRYSTSSVVKLLLETTPKPPPTAAAEEQQEGGNDEARAAVRPDEDNPDSFFKKVMRVLDRIGT